MRIKKINQKFKESEALRSRLYNLSASDIRFKYNQLIEETEKQESKRKDEIDQLKLLIKDKDGDIDQFFSELKTSEGLIQDQKELIQELKTSHGINFETDSIVDELKFKEKEIVDLRTVRILIVLFSNF